jgi:hypothetical protein
MEASNPKTSLLALGGNHHVLKKTNAADAREFAYSRPAIGIL